LLHVLQTFSVFLIVYVQTFSYVQLIISNKAEIKFSDDRDTMNDTTFLSPPKDYIC